MKRKNINHSYLENLVLALLTTILFVCCPSWVNAQITVNINATGTTGSYITGSVNATGTKNDGDMVNINSTTNRGWATFDLSSIPVNAIITGVTLNFTTTTASVTSFASNFIYGFNGNPATMAGSALYTACGSGTSLDVSTWVVGGINTSALDSTGLSFIQTNIGQTKVNLGFVRGSTNMYHIYGYGTIPTQQPQLSITYKSNCVGSLAPIATLSSVASVCAGANLNLSLQNSFNGQYGITYQWQTSSNGITFKNSLYDTLPTFSTAQTSTTYYQCIVGCSFTSTSVTSSIIQVRQNDPTSCYCESSATNSGDEEIFCVQFGGLYNTSNCSTIAPGPGSINKLYSNYATLAPISFTKGLKYNLGVTINTCGNFYGENVAAFIDYNQDGDFLDAGENIYASPYATGAAGAVRGGSVSIPCNALTGKTGLRVVYTEGGGSSSCGTYTYGETEDYLINIIDNVLAYVSSNTIQQTGIVSLGASDEAILRVPISMAGCGVATINKFVFNTIGTSNASDIKNAKLYRTDNSRTFTTDKLIATINNPSGSVVFAITDTLLNNDTTNYWLAYDINSNASVANVLDGRLDSIEILGVYRSPIISNPAGNVVISLPMTYVSSNATQSILTKVESGSINNRVLGMEVVTSATGAAINLTQFDLSANGTTDTANIKNIKVWYTGNSNTFAMTNQFGATLPALPAAASFSIAGTQGLSNDTNYFWLTYDIVASATVGNIIDAELISATVAGISQVPTISAPTGTRQIRAQYCKSSATNIGDEEIIGVQFGALNNTSNCSTTAPGPGSSNQLYSNYTTLAPVSFTKGLSYNLGVTINTCGNFYGENIAAFIDYNQDGDFLDAGENIYTSSYDTGTVGAVHGGLVAIPCNASLGETRMRVVYTEGGGSASCGTYSWGETEDYLINIVNLSSTSNLIITSKSLPYTWNGLTFNTSGSQTKLLTNSAGCDSSATLNLTVYNIPSYIPNNGLVAWYPFNGNANDESGNGNNGIVNGAIYSQSIAVTGESRYGYNFNSITDKISIPSIQCNNILNYSVTGYFKKNANQSFPNVDGTIFSQSNGCGGSNGLRLFIGTDNHIYFLAEQLNVTCNSVGKYSSNKNFNDGNWHFFAAVFETNGGLINSSNFRLVVDGQNINDNWNLNSNIIAPISNLNNSTTLGNVNSGVDAMIGSIDDVTIYNRALTQTEITQLYTNCIATVSTTNLTIPSTSLPYTWNGLTFNAAGSQTKHLTNAGGCDSTATLNLTVINTALPSYLPANGLVAWWPFNGNANDESGNGNHGTVNGATLTTDRNGNANKAYSFNGISSNISFNLNSIGNTIPTNTEFTTSVWVKTSDNNGPLISMQGIGGFEYDMHIGTLADVVQSSGNYGMLVRDNCCGTGNNIFGGNVVDNIYHMLTVVRLSNGTLKLYKDGALVAVSSPGQSGTLTFSPLSMAFGADLAWAIGGSGCGSCNSIDQQHLNGTLDDICVWNRALSQTEITALYSSPQNEINLNLTAFLEGSYTGSSNMSATPNKVNAAISNSIADTIIVVLHANASPYSTMYSSKGVVNTNGTATIAFPNSVVGGNYYIVIKHRNSIETWSASPIAINSNTIFNFTTSASQAFGSNLSNLGDGVFAIYSGDINQDGSVDFNDYPDLDIASNLGILGYDVNDLNGDASVDFIDYPILDINSNIGVLTIRP